MMETEIEEEKDSGNLKCYCLRNNYFESDEESQYYEECQKIRK